MRAERIDDRSGIGDHRPVGHDGVVVDALASVARGTAALHLGQDAGRLGAEGQRLRALAQLKGLVKGGDRGLSARPRAEGAEVGAPSSFTSRTIESRGNGPGVSLRNETFSGKRERRLYGGLYSAIMRSSRTSASSNVAHGSDTTSSAPPPSRPSAAAPRPR